MLPRHLPSSVGRFPDLARTEPHLVAGAVKPSTQSEAARSVILGGVDVDLMSFDTAVRVVIDRASMADAVPLAVCSANLDHIEHFGHGGRWADCLGDQSSVEWLTLMDWSIVSCRRLAIKGSTSSALL